MLLYMHFLVVLAVYKRQAYLGFLLPCITPVSVRSVLFTTNDFIPFSGSKGITFAIIIINCIMISTVVNIGAIVSVQK